MRNFNHIIRGGKLLLVAIILVTSFASCRKDPRLPKERCENKGILREHNDKVNNCFVRLIEKSDGTLLEPVNQKELYAVGLEVNEPITYTFHAVQTFGINCTEYVPVEVTCIKAE